MAWIESHQSLGRHPKLLRLAGFLKINKAQAMGHLHYLWHWALDYAKDGDLSKLAASEVASAAEWDGGCPAFLEGLISCGWIDGSGHIHDWMNYAGRYMSDRARQKKWRDKNVTLHKRDNNVSVTSYQPTVPTNSTIPTIPTKKEASLQRFQRPSPQEVKDYALTINFTLNGDQFCDFYSSKGWKIGNSPMKDWKAAVRNWKKRDVATAPFFEKDKDIKQRRIEKGLSPCCGAQFERREDKPGKKYCHSCPLSYPDIQIKGFDDAP